MVAIRIEFDDDEQYERLKELKKHRGLTWKALLLEGERRKSERIPLNKRRTWFVPWSVGFTPAVNGGTLSPDSGRMSTGWVARSGPARCNAPDRASTNESMSTTRSGSPKRYW